MKMYEFMEKVHIYYTVYAESEDEAWAELDKLVKPIYHEDHQVDVVECFINYVDEVENVE
jgi:Trp operon repressor